MSGMKGVALINADKTDLNDLSPNLQGSAATMLDYENTALNYTISHPSGWFAKYITDGEKREAIGIIFSSREDDLRAGDGGLPQGAKVDLFMQDPEEFKEIDDAFPKITSIRDWLDWQEQNQPGSEADMRGQVLEVEISFNGIDSVLQVYEYPTVEEYEKSMIYNFLNPAKNKVFVIQLTGSDPVYSDQIPTFDKIARSFKFNN